MVLWPVIYNYWCEMGYFFWRNNSFTGLLHNVIMAPNKQDLCLQNEMNNHNIATYLDQTKYFMNLSHGHKALSWGNNIFSCGIKTAIWRNSVNFKPQQILNCGHKHLSWGINLLHVFVAMKNYLEGSVYILIYNSINFC